MSAERPTHALIESKKIVEGQHYDFKRVLDLDKKSSDGGKDAKVRFIDDVVAFLNSDGGYLVIGVDEKDGAWSAYRPFNVPRDPLKSRILNTIVDNIDPAPKVDVDFIDVDGGYIFYIAIARQGLQPYSNKITGSYYERIGSRNRPISRGEVQARFKSHEDWERDLSQLFQADSHRLQSEDYLRQQSGRLPLSGWSAPGRSWLLVGILPRQHYDRSASRYNASRQGRSEPPSFFGGGLPPLRAIRDGFDASIGTPSDPVERLFISTDWYVSLTAINALELDRFGRLGLSNFKNRLKQYLASLNGFLCEYGIAGPFCVQLELTGLSSSQALGMFFNDADSVEDSRPRLIASLDQEDWVDDFCERVRSASTR